MTTVEAIQIIKSAVDERGPIPSPIWKKGEKIVNAHHDGVSGWIELGDYSGWHVPPVSELLALAAALDAVPGV